MFKIFVVEDDENIRELVLYALKSSGFEAFGFESCNKFYKEMNKVEEQPHLIILDIMLPESDGLTILREIRSNSLFSAIPVIMLTAKASEFDKVKGLDIGADDYISKPFGVMELIARINAVLRRSNPKKANYFVLTYKNICLDTEKHTVTVDGENIVLTFKEFELLHYLLLNQQLVLSRDKILDAVWGYDFESESRTVDMHIKTLRQKLKTAGEHVITIRNVGYKLGE